jgi:SpoVK/Ycf46/Vps4 family AAA+-type ATPase
LVVEELNLKLDSAMGFPDLKSIINVVQLYNQFCQHTISLIKQYHEHTCFYCSNCKQQIPERLRKGHSPPSIPSNINYTQAICYYSGINGIQYQVLEKLKNSIAEIQAIDNMIGMTNIKTEFARVVKYLATCEMGTKEPLMHMGIYGPPGHGKTQIARLIGKAFAKSGLLSKPDVFVLASRADLIGAYCGHTAKNTTKMFDQARGGVIFIDEIYSLGNPEKKDVFTKECIDTINQLLSERTDTLWIIAGYEDDADQSFFSYNKGLARRFPFNFVIKAYSKQELVQIFTKLAKDDGWKVQDDALDPEDLDLTLFDNAGGDMENLLVKSIMAHYENCFLSSQPYLKVLTKQDVKSGIEAYKLNKKSKQKLEKEPPFGMYI